MAKFAKSRDFFRENFSRNFFRDFEIRDFLIRENFFAILELGIYRPLRLELGLTHTLNFMKWKPALQSFSCMPQGPFLPM